ncbi:DUF1801 domain-containing protein [Confluentibacter flavum]|uniref:YdhG-like domain-containing protein n=1 Tax=Confluentibacter flavum TaxID=1909700 RepID=A0A2N3HJ60_9FLAO|nr:DUF1801 domain-containing protein [Confluentibacter flavum]PKQ44997.1 hypothetical protein CSW08_10310 [Confluentibacter flavum]
MPYQADSPDNYIGQLPEDRKDPISKLRKAIKDNLPKGFEEGMSYGMIGYYVPHTIYPNGYHCDPKLPLPFLSIASQKNSINFYHMGIYAKPEVHDWFVAEFPKHTKRKLDMGKSCIRFKYVDDIPYELLGELCKKMTPQEWISLYEKTFKKE